MTRERGINVPNLAEHAWFDKDGATHKSEHEDADDDCIVDVATSMIDDEVEDTVVGGVVIEAVVETNKVDSATEYCQCVFV